MAYECQFTLSGHEKSISSVKFSPDGLLVGSASSDGTVRLFDCKTGVLHAILEGHLSGISDFDFSPCGKRVCTCSDDNNLHLYELADTVNGIVQPAKVLKGHSHHVYCVCYNPQGNLVVSGSQDETIRVWNTEGACVRSLPAHNDAVVAVNFNKDGTLIVSCSFDANIRIWDFATGQCLKTLIDDANIPVSFVKFSPNGKFILAATLDSTIRLWNYYSGKVLKTYTGHCNRRFCLFSTFSVTGEKCVVTGSENHEVVVYNLQTKEVTHRLRGHEDVVIAVAAHPFENVIASGGLGRDRTMKIWRQK